MGGPVLIFCGLGECRKDKGMRVTKMIKRKVIKRRMKGRKMRHKMS